MVYQGKAHPCQSEASLLVEQSLILELHTCPESRKQKEMRPHNHKDSPSVETTQHRKHSVDLKKTYDGVVEDVPYAEAQFSVEEEESY